MDLDRLLGEFSNTELVMNEILKFRILRVRETDWIYAKSSLEIIYSVLDGETFSCRDELISEVESHLVSLLLKSYIHSMDRYKIHVLKEQDTDIKESLVSIEKDMTMSKIIELNRIINSKKIKGYINCQDNFFLWKEILDLEKRLMYIRRKLMLQNTSSLSQEWNSSYLDFFKYLTEISYNYISKLFLKIQYGPYSKRIDMNDF